jgi:hypothetical protein
LLDKGTEVAGYRIDGVLGQGGMGVVYEATQLSLNRKVALKLLATHLGEDPQFRERFRREALIQAAIDHPHIVTVYEAGDAPEGLFISMRLVRGPNLKDMILSRELDAGRSLRILTPIAEALDSAHEASLIHRDIKPQNILVSGRDHAYLADFGLTKAPGEKSLTKTGQFVGTLDYISPEQIRGHKATTASDIYALAAVLYECLSGVVPYPKDSEAAVLFAHMSDEPPKVTDQRPELPDALDEVIARAMSKEPGDRHPTASELLRDAERAFGKRVRAAITPPGPLEGPEEAGIRPPEGKVRTRESRVQDSDELAAAAGGATRLADVEGTKVAETADETRIAAGADATRVGDAGDVTRIGDAGDATRIAGAAAGATKLGGAAAGETRLGAATAPPPPPGTTTAERRTPLVPIVVGLALLLAIAGFFVGSSGGGEEEGGADAPEFANSASAGPLKLSFPQGWREDEAPEVPGLEFQEPIALAAPGAAGAGLVAGQTEGSGPTLLPASFREQIEGELRAGEPVKLGDLEAYRYRDVSAKGFESELTLYAIPHEKGVATVACFAPAARAREIMPGCEAIAATLELRDSEPVALGPSQAYADALNATLGTLNSQRAAGRTRLRAARLPTGQADAATQVARAYDGAVRQLRRAPVPPAAREAHDGIVTALGAAEAAYARLASAARRGDRRRYSLARGAVTRAESGVQRALGRLRALGYTVA